MATKTEIANLALSHLGIGKEIADLDNEKSQEAVTMRRFYEQTRDAVLRDFPWPFATRFAALALVADPPTETEEWAFSYRYPTDCLMMRRIQIGSARVDTNQSRIVFKTGRDDQGQLIYTDEEEAKIEYTFREEDPQRYPADFQLAFSLRLAHYAAPRLTGGDPFKLGLRAVQLYIQEISMAQASASNESVPDQVPDAETIRAREGEFLPPGRGNGTPFI
jgi:hypothetical protein